MGAVSSRPTPLAAQCGDMNPKLHPSTPPTRRQPYRSQSQTRFSTPTKLDLSPSLTDSGTNKPATALVFSTILPPTDPDEVTLILSSSGTRAGDTRSMQAPAPVRLSRDCKFSLVHVWDELMVRWSSVRQQHSSRDRGSSRGLDRWCH
jgi:hypothetical protein